MTRVICPTFGMLILRLSRNEADTLGRERELDVLAEPSILTPGEAYTLALKVNR